MTRFLPTVRRPFASRAVHGVVSASIAAFLASVTLAGDLLSIRTLAPEKSVLVVGADNITRSRERLEKTPLAGWWNAEETQKALKDMREEFEKGMGEWTQELGVPRDALTCPAAGGAAIFLQLNEETGAEEPAFIVFLDWGKDVDGFTKVYDAAIAKIEKEKPMPFTVEDMKGHRVYVFQQPKPATPAGEDADEGMQSPLDSMKLCVTRDEGRFLMTGGTTAMEDLLVRIEGAKSKSVSDNDDFKGSMDLIGGDPDVYATLLTEKALSLLAAVEPQSMFMFGMVTPFIQPVVGDIRGWSFGFSLDTSKQPMSQSIGAYMPAGKVGLMSLFGTSKVEPVPAAVPGDALSYGRMNVKFGNIVGVVEDILAKLPEGMGDQAKQSVEPFMPKFKSSFAAMGNALHVWTPSTAGDAGAEALASVTAIPVTDAKAAQGIMEIAGDAAMLKPRDFLGNTIYSTDDPAAPSFGFSAQYMLMGSTEAVETALRALGSKDSPSLSADPNYQAAAAVWSKDELVGWGYSNTIGILDTMNQMSDAASAAGPLGNQLENSIPLDAFEDVLTPEFLKKFFGPSAWQLTSTKTGFRFDSFTLGPIDAAKK
ncbi:MAG: hypothetical protein JNM94_09810 [Phycisphaerae bacterium]|nr:hypothetical protein [Phycisphaerae bacterium]